MTLHIPDDILNRSGVTLQEAALELACRLFDLGRIDLSEASRIADVPRERLERELEARKIPLYRPSVAEFEADLRTLKELDQAA